MKIAGYIGDLLYDYECVVIPGLGGFITNDKPAQVINVTHHFKPPFRVVHFNAHLKTNDGLLVNYVAAKENLSYREAKSRVDQFAFQCTKALENGKRIKFHGIGNLHLTPEKNIEFTQDLSINYNPQAFGLGSFVSPAIARTTEEEKILGAIKKVTTEKKPETKTTHVDKKPPRKRMVATRRKTPFVKQLIFLMVVFFLMGAGYIYMHRHAMGYYYDRHASKVPFLYTNPHSYIARNINMFPFGKITYYAISYFPGLFQKQQTDTPNSEQPEINKASLLPPMKSANTISKETLKEKTIENKEDLAEKVDSEKPVVAEPVQESPKEMPEVKTTEKIIEISPVKVQRHFSYFLIAGSFNSEANARKLVAELRNKGFQAEIADTNKYGMYRVAYEGFETETEALQRLQVIKSQNNPEAWLLKK
jgi:hypothetical protein